jgi:hypothetical protein
VLRLPEHLAGEVGARAEALRTSPLGSLIGGWTISHTRNLRQCFWYISVGKLGLWPSSTPRCIPGAQLKGNQTKPDTEGLERLVPVEPIRERFAINGFVDFPAGKCYLALAFFNPETLDSL